ncbi:MAG TPA: cytochrome c3 family protein, partial [Polyangia bacterium]|nr:cytochrome c3 family protein [Polyangia bacterium]
PPTQLCLNCHSQVWNKSPLLEPVRQSFFQNKPIEWRRVNKVPEYVYFNHSIHVNKGVGCVSCHGRVDKMPAVEKAEPLTMGFCLDCHRHPEQHLRPVSEVVNMDWKPEGGQTQEEVGKALIDENHVHTRTSCTTCHR